MVRAFSVFPRMGSPVEFRWTEDGKPLPNQTIKPVMSPYAAWMIADILSDRSSRFVGFGPAPALATPFESMFKTGTANQFQHIWALGATRRFTVGVWMGNFSGETVIGSTGSSIPARIAAKLLGVLEESAGQEKVQRTAGLRTEGLRTEGRVAENLAGPVPQGTTEVRICALSGMAAGPYCTGLTREFIRSGKIPAVCNWHTHAGLFYPSEYRSWLSERFRSGGVRQEGTGRIRTPVTGAVFYLDPSLPAGVQALRVETTGFSESALVFVDGELSGSLNHAGVYALPLLRGRHSITVADSGGSTAGVEIEVR
jgi:penicillin-binding protein 1C